MEWGGEKEGTDHTGAWWLGEACVDGLGSPPSAWCFKVILKLLCEVSWRETPCRVIQGATHLGW